MRSVAEMVLTSLGLILLDLFWWVSCSCSMPAACIWLSVWPYAYLSTAVGLSCFQLWLSCLVAFGFSASDNCWVVLLDVAACFSLLFLLGFGCFGWACLGVAGPLLLNVLACLLLWGGCLSVLGLKLLLAC